MMRSISFLFLSVLFLGSAFGGDIASLTKSQLKKLDFNSQEIKKVIKLGSSVALLKVEDKRKKFMACTAFLVQKKGSTGVFLTNAHCFTARHLRGKLNSYLSFRNPSRGKRVFKKCKKVLKRDDLQDLALISCPIPSRSRLIPVKFEEQEEEIERNQELVLLHQNCFKSGCKIKNQKKKLHKFRSLISTGHFLHYEGRGLQGVSYIKCRPGSSGAPILDRNTLKVIGVLQAGDERFGEGQFITLSTVLRFLEKNNLNPKF